MFGKYWFFVQVLTRYTFSATFFSAGVMDCMFHPKQPWLFTSGSDSIVKLYCNWSIWFPGLDSMTNFVRSLMGWVATSQCPFCWHYSSPMLETTRNSQFDFVVWDGLTFFRIHDIPTVFFGYASRPPQFRRWSHVRQQDGGNLLLRYMLLIGVGCLD